MKKGQRFRIVNARNFHGPAIVSGAYRGVLVVLPMKQSAPAQPVGMPKYKLPITEPDFAAFVLQVTS